MLIVANWKAYIEDLNRAKKLLLASKKLASKTECDIVIAPPAPFLGILAANNKSQVAFSAQDVSITLGGAETGEATAAMFKSAGATYAIIGHSERRAQADTNAIVAEKLAHALARDLIPILCVGEQERDGEGRYLSYVREEITSAIAPLTPKERTKIILAYEPLWAIGKTADHAIGQTDLTEMVLYLRKILAELIPGKHSQHALVLYGGSVEPENIRDLARASLVDGFLIGHASVDETMLAAIAGQLASA